MKRVLLAVLVVCSSATGFAQSFQIGVKGGVNFSNYTGGDFDTDGIVGFHVGGLMNFKFGQHFSIQPEVLFSSQGAKIKSNLTGDQNVRVSYVTVPMMLKLKSNRGFYIEAGPQVSFRAGEDFNEDASVDHFAKNLDLSLAGGVGYHSRSGFGIGARYIAGLSKVGDFEKSTLRDPDFKNSVVQVSLFYTLFNNK